MDINNICPHCLSELKKGESSCGLCGKSPQEMGEIKHYLKPLTILQGKYLLGDVLGEEGSEITYVGLDINLEIKVLIKEFYPTGHCSRDGMASTEISIDSDDSLDFVNKGREDFINEARRLAKNNDTQSSVGIKGFFQENNTAYIVQEYVEKKPDINPDSKLEETNANQEKPDNKPEEEVKKDSLANSQEPTDNTTDNAKDNVKDNTKDKGKMSKQSVMVISICSVMALLCILVIIAVVTISANNKSKDKDKTVKDQTIESATAGEYDVRVLEEEAGSDEEPVEEAEEEVPDTSAEDLEREIIFDLLKEYAEGSTFLANKEYPVDLELSSDGYFGEYKYSNIPSGQISYLIKDFDNDQDDELLLAYLMGADRTLLLTMYEYDRDANCVMEKDTYSYDYTYMLGDEGHIEVFTEEKLNNIVIYSKGEWYQFADGVGLDYNVLSYNGRAFSIEESTGYSGSDGFENYDFVAAVSRYADNNPDWDDLFCGRKSVSAYYNDVEMICKLIMPAGRDFMRRNAYMEDYTVFKVVGYAENGYVNDENVTNEAEVQDTSSEESGFIIADSDSRYVTEEELDKLTAFECRIARNEILARHGRMFASKDLQEYFGSQDWYDGYIAADDFNENKYLNQYEIENMYFIKDYENSHGY